MASALDRRLRQLEASVKTADGDGAVHVVFVRVGESLDEEVAKLGPIPRGDKLITVTFVKAADIQSPATMQ